MLDEKLCHKLFFIADINDMLFADVEFILILLRIAFADQWEILLRG
jgi:hypothetical protein